MDKRRFKCQMENFFCVARGHNHKSFAPRLVKELGLILTLLDLTAHPHNSWLLKLGNNDEGKLIKRAYLCLYLI